MRGTHCHCALTRVTGHYWTDLYSGTELLKTTHVRPARLACALRLRERRSEGAHRLVPRLLNEARRLHQQQRAAGAASTPQPQKQRHDPARPSGCASPAAAHELSLKHRHRRIVRALKLVTAARSCVLVCTRVHSRVYLVDTRCRPCCVSGAQRGLHSK